MRNILLIMLLVLLTAAMLVFTGCAPSRSVQRISTDEAIDLSGRWNDTDSRLVAEQMISDVLARRWLTDFRTDNRRAPVVIVLINSGEVRFVADSAARQEIREERLDQQVQATEESAARLAAEFGADYMLQGAIRTIVDTAEGQQVKFYQVDLELVNLENNEKVWIGNKLSLACWLVALL